MSGSARPPDPRLRALYATPPAQFTAARDRLARALAAEGRAEAAQVARLRRPPRAAWLVDALAQGRPELVSAVLEAADRLREAQARSAGGGAAALRTASADLHGAVDAALAAARGLAAAAGRGPTAAVLGEVARGLRAAATAAPQVREALRQGVLERLPAPDDVELLAALAPAPRQRPPGGRAGPRAAAPPGGARRRSEAARELAEAAGSERQRRRALAEAERLERARRAAEARLTRAEVAVAEAERRLAQARRAADDARAAARTARSAAAREAAPAR